MSDAFLVFLGLVAVSIALPCSAFVVCVGLYRLAKVREDSARQVLQLLSGKDVVFESSWTKQRNPKQ